MPVAIRAATRIQDMDDANVTLGVGVDEYALCWDNDTAKFVLRAPTDLSGYLLKSGGTMTGALDFNYQGTKRIYGTVLTVNAGGGADYATIASALAVATSGTTVLVMAGTYAETITVPAGVNLIGQSSRGVIVSGGTVTLGSGSRLESIEILSTNISGYVIYIETGSVVLKNLSIGAAGSFSATSYIVYHNGTGTLLLDQCLINATAGGAGTGQTIYGVYCNSTAILQIYRTNMTIGYGGTWTIEAARANNPQIYQSVMPYPVYVKSGISFGSSQTGSVIGAKGPGGNADSTYYPLLNSIATTGIYNTGVFVAPSWRPAADSTTALQLQNAAGTSVLNVDTTNARVGIGMTAPGVTCEVSSALVSPSGQLRLTAPNLGSGSNISFGIGKALSSGNMGFIAWDNQSTACLSVETYGGANPFRFYGSQVLVTNSNIYPASTGSVLRVQSSTATTNAIDNVLTLGANVTGAGVGAAGLGAGLLFTMETTTTVDTSAARIQAIWYEATHATRKSDLVLTAYDAGGEREGLRIRGDGSAPAIGFYGVAPIARAILATGAGATADNIITALQNLGLVKQS